MGFLAPWFLAGVAAVGLPIYVHLLRQYKSKPLPFSSLMFFEQRLQSSVKHRRLKYLVLFAMRCAFVALLVLAFSRPFIHSNAIAAGGAKTVIIAVDNSFSMRQDGRFAQAKQGAFDQLAKLGVGDRAQVVTFGGSAKLLSGMTTDKAELRGAIQSIEPGDGASSYSDLSRVLRSTVESLKSGIEAHVFTDIQKSSMPAAFADLRLDDGTKLEIHAVAKDMIPNFTVESVDAPSRVFDTKKVRTLATIAGFNTEEATKKVTLLANGKPLESKTVKVPANGRATVEFLSLEAPYGLSKGEVRLDNAGDGFPDDDHWYFAVERADPKLALFVHSEGDQASGLYLKTALASSNEPAFTVESVSAGQAANQNLSKYAFVMLSDPGPLAEKFTTALKEYVQKGGSVLISLGRNAVPGRTIPVAELQVAGVHFVSPDKERSLTVASVDTSYPSFARATNWDGVEFYSATRVLLPENVKNIRVAAKLSDGTPLLLDQSAGEGHVLLFASAFDNISNNLPIQPVWIPFIEQTTHEMGGIGASRGNYKVGAYVELRSAREKNVPVEVISPNGQRALTLSESAKAQNFQFPSQGFFDIRRANGHEELAAVNPDRRESDFTVVPQETLEYWKNTGKGTLQPDGAKGSSEGEKSELWWYVLVALFLLAIAESVFGNRHLGSEEPQIAKKEAA